MEETVILDKSGKAMDDGKGPGEAKTLDGKLKEIEIEGKMIKIVNTVTVMEIIVHKLETGQELSQVVAHEFMMVDHKQYMVKLLTEAMNTVMRAGNKKASIIKTVSTLVAHKLGLLTPMNREARRKLGK